MERFDRQSGLLYQKKVEELNLHFIGYSPITAAALRCLAFLNAGARGNIYIDTDETVSEKHTIYDTLLDAEDIGKELGKAYQEKLLIHNEQLNVILGKPNHSVDLTVVFFEQEANLDNLKVSNYVFSCLCADGFYIGKKPIIYSGEKAGQLTMALSNLAAGILTQEILKVCGCIRPVVILNASVQAKLVLQSNLVEQSFEKDKMPFSAQHYHNAVPLEAVLQTKDQEGVYTIDLGEKAKSWLDNFIIGDNQKRPKEIESYLFSLFGWCKENHGHISYGKNEKLNPVNTLNATVFGVGALGTLTAEMLVKTKIKDLHLNLLDADMEVESSNRNRQALYSQDSIGKPKVFEAEKALKKINSDVSIHIYPLQLNEVFLEVLDFGEEEEYIHPNDMALDVEIDQELELQTMLAKDIQSSVLISAFDSMKARWLIEQVQAKLKLPLMVNGGTNGLTATADICRFNYDKSLEERYGAWIKEDEEFHSCTGELPLPSCITSSVIAASLQVLFILTKHHKPQQSFFRFSEQHIELESYSFIKPI